MNKSTPIILIILAVLVVILARYPHWSSQRPIPYEWRSDGWVTELMAGRPLEELPENRQRQLDSKGGKAGPLQSHRYVTPLMLRKIPAVDWKLKWIVNFFIWGLVGAASCWYIGLKIGHQWRYGAICVALWLATVGWMIGRLPWHKDTTVSGLEMLVVALLVYKRWTWLSVALVVGVLCKESFVFLAAAVCLGLMVEQIKNTLEAKRNEIS